jgi:hypothetical protein
VAKRCADYRAGVIDIAIPTHGVGHRANRIREADMAIHVDRIRRRHPAGADKTYEAGTLPSYIDRDEDVDGGGTRCLQPIVPGSIRAGDHALGTSMQLRCHLPPPGSDVRVLGVDPWQQDLPRASWAYPGLDRAARHSGFE